MHGYCFGEFIFLLVFYFFVSWRRPTESVVTFIVPCIVKCLTCNLLDSFDYTLIMPNSVERKARQKLYSFLTVCLQSKQKKKPYRVNNLL